MLELRDESTKDLSEAEVLERLSDVQIRKAYLKVLTVELHKS